MDNKNKKTITELLKDPQKERASAYVVINARDEGRGVGTYELKDLKKDDIFLIYYGNDGGYKNMYKLDGHHVFILLDDTFKDKHSFQKISAEVFDDFFDRMSGHIC